MRARNRREVAIEVGAATIRQGDAITVGGHLMTVENLFNLPSGSKRIDFLEGTTLTLPPEIRLTIFRTAKGW